MKAKIYPYASVGFYLKKLPMSARMKATRNIVKAFGSRELKKQTIGAAFALQSGFGWVNSPEGRDYWFNVAAVAGS